MTDRIIAFAGPGEASPKWARENLDTWIGNHEVTGFYVPDSIDQRNQPGLASVVGYLTKYWAPDDGTEDAFEAVPAHALLESIAKQQHDEGGEPHLVVVVGEAPLDGVTKELIDQARADGIPVLDLAAGMDEYTVTDEPAAEEADAAPEEPAERPKRRRRTTSTPAEEKPAEEPSEPRKTRGRPRTKEENEERAEETLEELRKQREDAENKKRVRDSVNNLEKDEPPFEGATRPASDIFPQLHGERGPELIITDSTEQFRSLLVVALQGALDALQGRTGKVEETLPYVVDEQGNILKKRGKGRPGKNDIIEHLTRTEAAARGYTEED